MAFPGAALFYLEEGITSLGPGTYHMPGFTEQEVISWAGTPKEIVSS